MHGDSWSSGHRKTSWRCCVIRFLQNHSLPFEWFVTSLMRMREVIRVWPKVERIQCIAIWATCWACTLKGFHKIITESIPTFNVIFLTLLSPLTFIFKHFQAPNRLCKFGPDCQKPRCRFDHLPPPMAMPLLEYDLAPQGYNIQPTDTGHVQEVHWPLSY